MKLKLNLSLIFASLLICQLPVYAQSFFSSLPEEQQMRLVGTSRFNHFGALSEIPENGTTRKYLFYNSPNNLFADDFLTGVYIRNNTLIEPLQKLTKRIYEPNVFIAYDPTMRHLFAAGGTRNFVIQYDYNPVVRVTENDPGGFFQSNQYGPPQGLTFDFQTPCQDGLTGPDTLRSIQMIQARDGANNVISPISYNKVYITCENTSNVGSGLNNRLLIIGYGLQYGPVTMKGVDAKVSTATLAELPGGPTKTNGVLNKNGGTRGKLVGNLSVNSSVILFSPSGKFLYTVNSDNKLHQYTFSATGELTQGNLSGNDGCSVTKTTGEQGCNGTPPVDYFTNPGTLIIPEQTPLSINASLTPVSMTFNPSGTNVYMVANTVIHMGEISIVKGSTILVYRVVDPTTGVLALISTNEVSGEGIAIPNASQIVFNPNGKYAYVLDSKAQLIYEYRVSPDVNGGLTQQPIHPTFRPTHPVQSLIFDSAGFNAFGVEYDKSKHDFTLQSMAVNSDGTLGGGQSAGAFNSGSSSVNRNIENFSRSAAQPPNRSSIQRRPAIKSVMSTKSSSIQTQPVVKTNAPSMRTGSLLSMPW
jgi:hypothetical protein